MKKFSNVLAVFIFIIAVAVLVPTKASAAEYTLTGFVDASYTDFQYTDSTFALDEIELDIEAKLDEKTSLRLDVNYREVDSTGGLTSDEIFEQGYITYSTELGIPLEFTFGKFNAPIGFELLDPVDMFQFSHGLVFNNAIPTNVTGAMLKLTPVEMVEFNLYLVNGWDVNVDNNGSRTIGTRLGITPVEGVNIGLSYITGVEQPTGVADQDVRSVFDLDFTITAVDKLTIGGEYNVGTEENQSALVADDDAKWTAYSLMANYEVTEEAGLTLRYENFDDEEGSRLGLDPVLSNAQEVTSLTVAALYALGENAGVLFEYRQDSSSEDAYTESDGTPTDTMAGYALEFTYKF